MKFSVSLAYSLTPDVLINIVSHMGPNCFGIPPALHLQQGRCAEHLNCYHLNGAGYHGSISASLCSLLFTAFSTSRF
eukprot:c17604_g2_i1 orf=282-512(-)